MKTKADLLRKFQELRSVATTVLPRRLGEVMMKETDRNFRDEGYGNDFTVRKWAPRRNEQFLNYPKLQYRGFMRLSIRYKTRIMGKGRAVITLGSKDPVFRVHQLGGPTMPNGSHYGDMGFRTPPKSSKSVKIGGVRVVARPMIGFGRRSRKWFSQAINREISRIMNL